MNNLLNFFILYDLKWNFPDNFNWNDLRDFNHSINDFFNDFLNLDYFRYTSENFKNIVDINNIHDFLSNHPNDAFINI